MSVTILHGDCVETMRGMDPDSVDAIVTDPPYELGFMGKKWDASGIAYSVEMWSEALRVLKPGGHLLAFGGTRTYHRMACAIEDAGFEIRDCLQWLYGSGFPKSMNASRAIDLSLGVDKDTPSPATPEAEQWSGWGTAFKPANEPIVLARKPLSEKTVAANVLTHGTGAINIDGCRVGLNGESWGGNRENAHTDYSGKVFGEYAEQYAKPSNPLGRFPANVILSHSSACEPTRTDTGEVSVVCAEDCPVRMLDEQSGVQKSGVAVGGKGNASSIYGSELTKHKAENQGYADTGGASRFFYVAKASKRERNAGLEDSGNGHPTVKPVELMRYLIRMITPPGGIVLDPFAGSGTTGVAAIKEGVSCILIEREAEYLDIIRARVNHG